ncbi:MAG: UbiA family prenyltransferase [Theionarchaea archaeon]|nr:UbiA family prenyltransferase [Theionarchaea archaeon]MBU7038443.1 UbiA family prenyltransferase [Theionarchaea archaeon]
MVNPWVRAIRLQYYPTTGLILLVALSVSAFEGIVFMTGIVWIVAGNVLLHCACSLINEYRDFKTGADLVEYPQSGWSATGGSGVLKEQLLLPRQALRVSAILFLASWAIWLVLGYKTDYWVVFLMSGALLMTYLYSAAVSVGGFYYYRDVAMSLGSVPLVVVSVVKVLTAGYSLVALATGIIMGILILIYLLYHGIVDLNADSMSGKLRISRVLGPEKTRMVAKVLFFSTVLGVTGLAYKGVLPQFSMLIVTLLPPAIVVMWNEKRQPPMKTYNQVILLLGAAAVFLCSGFWVHLVL